MATYGLYNAGEYDAHVMSPGKKFEFFGAFLFFLGLVGFGWVGLEGGKGIL